MVTSDPQPRSGARMLRRTLFMAETDTRRRIANYVSLLCVAKHSNLECNAAWKIPSDFKYVIFSAAFPTIVYGL